MRNRTNLLSVASMAALLAMSGLAMAQTPGAAPAQPGGAMQREAPAAGGMQRDMPRGEHGGAMQRDERNTQSAPTAPSPSTAQAPQPQTKQPQNAAQGASPGEMKNGAKMGEQGGPRGERATVGSASSNALTVEQKTRIRESMLGGNAPRLGKVDFSITVGAVVPSRVHVVEVPATIVEIHPEWRGYRYFVANDEIIIVEPGTLRIVAVLAV